jgi:hypothetical protein
MDEDEKNLVLESDDPNPKAVGKAVNTASVNRNAEGFTLLRRAGPRTFHQPWLCIHTAKGCFT